ncbi:formyl transferase [Dipodascopsis tothii]|uniref:formyl transferase n=1 Tax=Dipodascopsis tothii TaxID=44089 RepID=UPI0034CFED67
MAVPEILVLISGNGSNLQALIDACAGKTQPALAARITRVVSSSATAYGLERAAAAGIATTVHALGDYYAGVPAEDKAARRAARKQFNVDLAALVLAAKPALVVCAGWMLILSPSFLEPVGAAQVPIINLHPALPGAFSGINAIERAWAAGQAGDIAQGGVMIHRVIREVDEGAPLVVKAIEMVAGEPLEAYERRVHALEHTAIVEGTALALAAL